MGMKGVEGAEGWLRAAEGGLRGVRWAKTGSGGDEEVCSGLNDLVSEYRGFDGQLMCNLRFSSVYHPPFALPLKLSP